MSDFIKSKKYVGVYYRKGQNGEITYYFTFRNESGQVIRQKVGTKSEGVDESYVNELRLRTISTIRLGELPPKVVRNNKHYQTTVNDITEFYFTYHQTKTNRKRLRMYENRIKPIFGDMSIYNVKINHIEDFKRQLLQEVSEQTTIVYLELLSTIFSYYSKKNQINLKNPVLLVERPRVDNVRQRFLSKDEIDELFEDISHDFTMTLFLSLSLCTGGRKSTVMNYKIKDVDLTHKMINSYDFKNDSPYKSFLDERTIELIKFRMTQTDDINENLVMKYGINDTDRWISRMFKIVLDNLFNQGLDVNDRKNRVVVHTFRHTVLSHLGMKGNSEFLIKKISNHKSTKMVGRYVKLDENSGKKEIQGLWE